MHIVLDLIHRKADFDRSVGGNHATLTVTSQALLETLWPDDRLPYAHVLLAKSSGDGNIPHHVLGMALYHSRYSSFACRPSIWLDDLYLLPTARVRGVGMVIQLLHELARVGREHQCTHIGWTAHANNARGLAFYQRLGASLTEQCGDTCYFQWKPKMLVERPVAS